MVVRKWFVYPPPSLSSALLFFFTLPLHSSLFLFVLAFLNLTKPGTPVKATLKPPTNTIPNSNRLSNPFTPDAEPDWISTPTPPTSTSTRTPHSPTPSATPSPTHRIERKPPPPPPRQSTASSVGTTSSQGSGFVSASESPIERSKVPPAIPRKPISLSSPAREERERERKSGMDLLGDDVDVDEGDIGWKPLLPQ